MAATILISLQPAGVIFALLLYICQIPTHMHSFAILCVDRAFAPVALGKCATPTTTMTAKATTFGTCLLAGRNVPFSILPPPGQPNPPQIFQIQFATLRGLKD